MRVLHAKRGWLRGHIFLSPPINLPHHNLYDGNLSVRSSTALRPCSLVCDGPALVALSSIVHGTVGMASMPHGFECHSSPKFDELLFQVTNSQKWVSYTPDSLQALASLQTACSSIKERAVEETMFKIDNRLGGSQSHQRHISQPSKILLQ